MWQGVEVRGTGISPGNLEVYSNSIVENAHIAILIGMRNPNYTLDSSLPPFYTGHGTLVADWTNFNDCGYGIYAVRLTNNGPISVYGNDLISITNCVFETTGETLPDINYKQLSDNNELYPSVENPYVYFNYSGRGNTAITLHKTPRVNIENNSFLNMEIGIEQITVRNDITGCEFDNLRYGIRAWGGFYNPKAAIKGEPYLTQSISGNVFTNIFEPQDPSGTEIFEFGIYEDVWQVGLTYNQCETAAIELNGVQFFDLVNNQFGNDNVLLDEYVENALVLDNAARFQMSENNIYGVRRGMVIIDSQLHNYLTDEAIWSYGASMIGPSNSNDGDKNKFFDCEIGIITDIENGTLHLRCNKHYNDNTEDEVTPYKNVWANRGFLLHQGEEDIDGTAEDDNLAAGNEFITPDENLIMGKWIYDENLDNLSNYTYVHHKIVNPEDYIYEPGVVEEDIIKVEDQNQIYNPLTSCNPVIETYTGGGANDYHQALIGFPKSIEDEIEELVELKASLDAWQSQTTALLNAIYGGVSDQMELKDFLKDNSPLSDEVLKAYMLKNDVPAEYFRDVIMLNSVVDKELQGLLKEKIKDLPQAIEDEIAAVMLHNPYIETVSEMERRIQYDKSVAGLYFNELMKNLEWDNNFVSTLQIRH